MLKVKQKLIKKCSEPKCPIKMDDINQIFVNIDSLAQVNFEFYSKLYSRLCEGSWETVKIGDHMKVYAKCFMLYVEWGTNYNEGLDRYCSMVKGRENLDEKLTFNKNLDLEALLIQPIQRLPRYHLLLTELLKNTDESHPDYQNLTEGGTELKSLCDRVNECVKKQQNVAGLLNTQHKGMLSVVDAKRYMTLSITAPVVMTTVGSSVFPAFANASSRKESYAIYLFNDILCFSLEVNAQKSKHVHQVPLNLVWTEAENDNNFSLIVPLLRLQVKTDGRRTTDIWLEQVRKSVLECLTGEAPKNLQPPTERQGEWRFPNGAEYTGAFSLGVMQGEGEMRHLGNHFVGNWIDGKMEGQGQCTYTSGAVYSGPWTNNLPNGRGKIVFPCGDRFEGDFVKGKKHGTGTFAYKGGDLYEGQFEDDVATGNGKLKSKGGKFIYTGQFRSYLFHGEGEAVQLYDGNKEKRYNGTFQFGMREGQGQYTDDKQEYRGEWKCNQYHGSGVLSEYNSFKYNGQFENGLFHGKGTLSEAGGKSHYNGKWCQGHREGDGIQIYYDGSSYEGEWKTDQRNGKGTLKWPSGDYYKGNWKKEVPNGHGVSCIALPEGGWIRFEGNWKKGLKDGVFTVSYKKGTIGVSSKSKKQAKHEDSAHFNSGGGGGAGGDATHQAKKTKQKFSFKSKLSASSKGGGKVIPSPRSAPLSKSSSQVDEQGGGDWGKESASCPDEGERSTGGRVPPPPPSGPKPQRPNIPQKRLPAVPGKAPGGGGPGTSKHQAPPPTPSRRPGGASEPSVPRDGPEERADGVKTDLNAMDPALVKLEEYLADDSVAFGRGDSSSTTFSITFKNGIPPTEMEWLTVWHPTRVPAPRLL